MFLFCSITKLIFPCKYEGGFKQVQKRKKYLLDTRENSHFRPYLSEDLQQCTVLRHFLAGRLFMQILNRLKKNLTLNLVTVPVDNRVHISKKKNLQKCTLPLQSLRCSKLMTESDENIYSYYTFKKCVTIFPSPNYSRPGRVWLVTSRRGWENR
jgi:hypothetical protein